MLLPKYTVVAVKYYTAEVSNRPPYNKQNDRQQAYFKALSTLSRVEIVKGYFKGPDVRWMPECDPGGSPLGKSVPVLKTEEKGSDLNLAVDLLYDCVRGCYDCAVIVSNDSDLVRAVRIVRQEYGKVVGMVNPHRGRPSLMLSKYASFRKRLTEKLLASAQFPKAVPIGSGAIHRPPAWS